MCEPAGSPSRRDDSLIDDPRWWARSDSKSVELLHRGGVGMLRRVHAPERIVGRYEALVHRGQSVECTVCGSTFRHFRNRWNARNVICWTCGAEERHRALWLVLETLRPDLLGSARDMLHFAPETLIERGMRRRRGLRYVTADIDPARGDLTLDICDLALPDACFDAIICIHVLEHVDDDRRAMRELHRILQPGGWAIVMVPMDHGLEATLEDPSVTDPAERRRLFWQEDHVRLYGPDLADRLADAGFEVEVVHPWGLVGEAAAERWRLNWGDNVYICRR